MEREREGEGRGSEGRVGPQLGSLDLPVLPKLLFVLFGKVAFIGLSMGNTGSIYFILVAPLSACKQV